MPPDQPFPGYWPNGPLRPPVATASGVLGLLTGALTAIVCLEFVTRSVSGPGDAVTMVMLVGGVPCAAGPVIGGIRLLAGRGGGVLLGSCVATLAVVLLALHEVGTIYDGEDALGVGLGIVPALPLPILTAALAMGPSVKGWTFDPRRR